MTRTELRQRIEGSLLTVRRTADEIRLDLHLASMDAKDRWRQLEPRLHEAERLAREVSDVSRRAIDEIADKLREFKTSLDDLRHEGRG